MSKMDFRHDPETSSSDLGQYIHDNYPVEFYFCDIDGAIYKKYTRIKRVLEMKRPGQPIKESQLWLLEDLAAKYAEDIRKGLLHPQSGVFCLWGEPPFDEITVEQVCGDFRAVLSGVQKDRFLQGWAIAKEG